jgi:hypothetical protein
LTAGCFDVDLLAFFGVLALITLLFVIPRVVVNRIVGGCKDKIVSGLTANYVAYVHRVLKGEEQYDANTALQHHETRSSLDRRFGERRDLLKGLLPIILPLVNSALAYVVQTSLTRIV